MNDDLPLPLVPSTRMLVHVSMWLGADEVVHILERSGLLLLAHAAGAIDGAHLTAGVAVAAAVRHAFGPGIWIGVDERGRVCTTRNWRHDGEVVGRCHSVLLDGRSAEVGAVVANLVGNNGNGIRTVVSSKASNLGERRVVRKARRLSRQHCCLSLLPQGLLLG